MLIVYIVLIVLFLTLKTHELPNCFILIKQSHYTKRAIYYTSVYNPHLVDGSLAKIIRLSNVYHL